MSVESEYERRALPDDPYPRVAPTVDAALVAFGLSEPPFKIEVVMGKIWIVPSNKQPGLKTLHNLRHVLTNWMCVLLEVFEKGLK